MEVKIVDIGVSKIICALTLVILTSVLAVTGVLRGSIRRLTEKITMWAPASLVSFNAKKSLHRSLWRLKGGFRG
ncbi:hypothetical protein F8388_024785 [Cannabis sativa]|uniref:Uncharacterized protein n=1 Tax=Cannabis sativa TaxID=3483 RepID=A0A7J6DZ64_CANSA|nr:hypothetical protein G4B88_015458 [Cannabis sativa]KAF4351453.1 hypothetical protein F8388_024785 [Cannabis sativa]